MSTVPPADPGPAGHSRPPADAQLPPQVIVQQPPSAFGRYGKLLLSRW